MEKVIKPQMFGIWKRMTERNYHSEWMVSVSKAFGYEDLNKKFVEIAKKHRKLHYLPWELYEQREKLYKKMMKRISKDYGMEMMEKVMSC